MSHSKQKCDEMFSPDDPDGKVTACVLCGNLGYSRPSVFICFNKP